MSLDQLQAWEKAKKTLHGEGRAGRLNSRAAVKALTVVREVEEYAPTREELDFQQRAIIETRVLGAIRGENIVEIGASLKRESFVGHLRSVLTHQSWHALEIFLEDYRRANDVSIRSAQGGDRARRDEDDETPEDLRFRAMHHVGELRKALLPFDGYFEQLRCVYGATVRPKIFRDWKFQQAIGAAATHYKKVGR